MKTGRQILTQRGAGRVALLLAALTSSFWITPVFGQQAPFSASNRDIPRLPASGRDSSAVRGEPRLRQSITLSPAVVELRGEPGQSASQQLTLQNDTLSELQFNLVARDVVVRDGKRVFVSAGEIPHSIAATAVFSRQSVTVRPGGSATVRVTVTVPAGTALRAVALVFQGAREIRQQGSVGLMASLATLLTFTLPGEARVSASPISVSPQSATTNIAVSQVLTNSGTEPVTPRGVLAILGPSGTLVGKASFASRRLLPGQRLEFRADYPAELKSGHYRAFASFGFEGQTITNSADFVVP